MGFELETDRLLIREWDPEDRRSLIEVAADPEVMRFVGKGDTWTPEKVDAFISRQMENVKRYGYCLGALSYKSTGSLIGLAGLQPLGTTDEVEVAWWLPRAEAGSHRRHHASREQSLHQGDHEAGHAARKRGQKRRAGCEASRGGCVALRHREIRSREAPTDLIRGTD